MPRIFRGWGFEERLTEAEWEVLGYQNTSNSNTTSLTSFYRQPATAGLVGGDTCCSIYASWAFGSPAYNHAYHVNYPLAENQGSNADASGRLAVSVYPGSGTSGYTNQLLSIFPAGKEQGAATTAWHSSTWPIAQILATPAGAEWSLTLYVGNAAKEVASVALVRSAWTRVGLEFAVIGTSYYGRMIINGVAATDWYSATSSSFDVPESFEWFIEGINFTNSVDSNLGATYRTGFDDIIYVSDTITAINTGTQVVTRTAAEPINPCEEYFFAFLDTSGLGTPTGTWSGTKDDIDRGEFGDSSTKVSTTDTSTGKPLHCEVEFADTTGTTPSSIAFVQVRAVASADGTLDDNDIQLSDDSFSNSVTAGQDPLPSASTIMVVATGTKPSDGSAWDTTAVDACEARFRVT